VVFKIHRLDLSGSNLKSASTQAENGSGKTSALEVWLLISTPEVAGSHVLDFFETFKTCSLD